jgi:hypothetical protein
MTPRGGLSGVGRGPSKSFIAGKAGPRGFFSITTVQDSALRMHCKHISGGSYRTTKALFEQVTVTGAL